MAIPESGAAVGMLRTPLDPTAHVGAIEQVDDGVSKLLHRVLATPAMDMMLRPSRQFRGSLVQLGFILVAGREPHEREAADLAVCARSIELLHLGSLIVDDVQDGSRVRRGAVALHETVGVPQAIAVGNWLYFHAANLLKGVKGLGPQQTTELTYLYHEAVELAHLGQALDLGTRRDHVTAEEWQKVCMACGRMKTGSIVMLALVMGSTIGGGRADQTKALRDIGFALGVFLQRLNDLGSFLGSFDVEKRLEDVASAKPSFVWALVGKAYGQSSYDALEEAVKALPDETLLRAWKACHPLRAEALRIAEEEWCEALERCAAGTIFCSKAMSRLTELKEQIIHAYLS